MDFIAAYLGYMEETEPPMVFHRWTAISSVGAALGRDFYIPWADSRIIPNLYTMFVGDVGTRKSTAIKNMRRLLKKAGYNTFSADKTSKEKFLLDLEGLQNVSAGDDTYDLITASNLWGDGSLSKKDPAQVYIVADEFNEYATGDRLEFYALLGSLWDWDDPDGPYQYRLKNSASVSIYQPTINILGGNTQDSLARAFPAEIMGQGFMSRLLLIYGEPSGKKYTRPKTPDMDETNAIISVLAEIIHGRRGQAIIQEQLWDGLLDKIYKGFQDIPDTRFVKYSTRRFTQLLKLCLILAACKDTSVITDDIVIEANTVLTASEINMPKAAGEFGKNKNSDVTNEVLNYLAKVSMPQKITDLWPVVQRNLTRIAELQDLMAGLQLADKVQLTPLGWLAKKSPPRKYEFVDFSLLTVEERMMLNV